MWLAQHRAAKGEGEGKAGSGEDKYNVDGERGTRGIELMYGTTGVKFLPVATAQRLF